MKISKEYLKRLITEELHASLEESEEDFKAAMSDVARMSKGDKKKAFAGIKKKDPVKKENIKVPGGPHHDYDFKTGALSRGVGPDPSQHLQDLMIELISALKGGYVERGLKLAREARAMIMQFSTTQSDSNKYDDEYIKDVRAGK